MSNHLAFACFFTVGVAALLTVLFPSSRKDLLILWSSALALATFSGGLYFYLKRTENQVADRLQQKLQNLKLAEWCRGVDFRYYHQYLGHGIYSFTITVPAPSQGHFLVSKKGPIMGWVERVLGLHGLATWDARLDQEAVIETDKKEFATSFFMVAENSRAVRELLSLGFNSLAHDGSQLSASITPLDAGPKLERQLDPKVIEAGLRNLVAMTKHIPHAGAVPAPGSRQPNWKMRREGMMVFFAALMFLGLFLGWRAQRYPALDDSEIFLMALKMALPSYLALVWLAWRLLEGPTVAPRQLLALFTVGSFGWYCFFAGCTWFLNGRWDFSSPVPHVSFVRKKQSSQSRYDVARTYFAKIDSWKKPQGLNWVKISSDDYERIALDRSRIEVTTRQGRFGIEWVVSSRLLK